MSNNSEFDFEKNFPPLGHHEHHFNKYPNHPWLKKVKDIKSWIIENCVLDDGKKHSDFKVLGSAILINKDLTVSVNKDLSFTIKLIKETSFIPIQFREVNCFSCTSIGLKSLIGVPIRVESIIATYNKLDNLLGIKKESNVQRLFVANNNIKNLSEIKDLKNIKNINIFDNPIESLKDLPAMEEFVFINNGWKADSYQLLLEIPRVVRNIIISKVIFNDNRVKDESGFVDMDWLRKEQSLLEEKESLKNEISVALNEENEIVKRRKI